MTNRFYYSASTYIGEWMSNDRRYHERLAYAAKDETSDAEGTKCLVEAATYYKVIRTFKITGENPRLLAAYELLKKIERPEDVEDAVQRVEAFAEDLRNVYGQTPLSAASKFLWMRFRSPVVIYDSIASGRLKNYSYKGRGYRNYVEIWSNKYREFEAEIGQACNELKDFKKFTLAREVSDDSLTEWTNSQWFKERVFDRFLLNEAGHSPEPGDIVEVSD